LKELYDGSRITGYATAMKIKEGPGGYWSGQGDPDSMGATTSYISR
jgi:hypothetical protein